MKSSISRGAKRRAGASAVAVTTASTYDEKLLRVASALDNLSRVGTTCASGGRAQFPLPALAFRGDGQDELMLPLRNDDAQKIKAWAAANGSGCEDAVAWEVDGASLETRNPLWREFLGECVKLRRKTLGIAPAAVVETSLSKMVLVGSRGKLDMARRRGVKRAGVFGTLVVVLPGAFVGGDLVVELYANLHHSHTTNDKQAKMTSSTWQLSDRPNQYCVMYAAFYDDCVYEAEPVVSGAALCLVYDLLTMTPGEVPLFGGSAAIQRSIDTALEDYFHVGPASLVKRVKISDDAWRTINAFAAQRHFTYIVQGDSFEKLQGNERLVAENLAAFCAHSGGQYVLYHARVLCSRLSTEVSEYDSDFDDGNANETKVTLRAPWRKYGDAESNEFPPVYLRHANEVAPVGRVEACPLHVDVYSLDDMARDIVWKLHGELRRTDVYHTFALVVQPAPIETTQIAQLPMEDVFTRLRSLLPQARDEAIRYARQVLSHKPKWPVNRRNESELIEFVQILVEIDDLSLFKELLLLLDLKIVENEGALVRGIDHFGWHACVDSLVKRIQSTPSWGSRLNLTLSVIHRPVVEPAQVEPVVDALLSLQPWTEIDVHHDRYYYEFECRPGGNDFSRLVVLVNESFPSKMLALVTVTNIEVMTQFVVPSLEQLSVAHARDRTLRPLLLHVKKVLQQLMVKPPV